MATGSGSPDGVDPAGFARSDNGVIVLEKDQILT